jgi:glucose uptake protein GlcU
MVYKFISCIIYGVISLGAFILALFILGLMCSTIAYLAARRTRKVKEFEKGIVKYINKRLSDNGCDFNVKDTIVKVTSYEVILATATGALLLLRYLIKINL